MKNRILNIFKRKKDRMPLYLMDGMTVLQMIELLKRVPNKLQNKQVFYLADKNEDMWMPVRKINAIGTFDNVDYDNIKCIGLTY